MYNNKRCYFEGYSGCNVINHSDLILSRKEFLIKSRALRVFHDTDIFNEINISSKKNGVNFFCIVGLKGSGKSTILHEISKRGYSVVEIYKNLSSYINDIPSPEFWTTEPLEISLKNNDMKSKNIFIGSLLRPEEFLFLKNNGNVIVVVVETENKLRYSRLLKRGRSIEKDFDSLIALDLNRHGYSKGYETNDLGFWLSKNHENIVNDGSISSIVDKILLITNKYESTHSF